MLNCSRKSAGKCWSIGFQRALGKAGCRTCVALVSSDCAGRWGERPQSKSVISAGVSGHAALTADGGLLLEVKPSCTELLKRLECNKEVLLSSCSTYTHMAVRETFQRAFEAPEVGWDLSAAPFKLLLWALFLFRFLCHFEPAYLLPILSSLPLLI